ncbi:histidine phosphatase family protein (plasmid) [Qingshengfaniella alkalisoli]|uniref:phosphoglycerate mutase (2,3-diphosphoglycerate-dependent) n=1 Tax=Qingshengfaniella alkalisoli TaxID=2599296 RepID=A0A5B8J0M2_9RHOB|nr:histidine phosphatase family protein [Qingshengfaniella alkalisoli]
MIGHHIALIRHGAYHQRKDTPSALQPFPLTAEGEAQAAECGAEIERILQEQGLTLDPVLHSSCQLRAWQTALIAGEVLKRAGHDVHEVRQTPRLSERSLGSAANLTVREIEAVLDQDPRFEAPPMGWKSDSDYCLPLQGAESLMMAGERVRGYLSETMVEKVRVPPGTVTLFFGHGASFRHAAHLMGVLSRAEIAQYSMYHARPLRLCYTGGDKWVRCGGAWKPRRREEPVLD